MNKVAKAKRVDRRCPHYGWMILVGMVGGTAQKIASSGDWIIRGAKGELCPCEPDIFEATCELVEEPKP